jgi:small subunit ribosomal protein S13
MIFFLFRERPPKLTLGAALERTYGLGKYNSLMVARKHGLQHNTKLGQIRANLLQKIGQYVEKKFTIGAILRRNTTNIIEAIKKENSHRGRCHRANLPVHFQRTHTNAKTAKFRLKPQNMRNTKKGKKFQRQKKPKIT